MKVCSLSRWAKLIGYFKRGFETSEVLKTSEVLNPREKSPINFAYLLIIPYLRHFLTKLHYKGKTIPSVGFRYRLTQPTKN